METTIVEWNINELHKKLDVIQNQPKYQRGAVWTLLKRQMLIDSMLRGIDIPKLYLRKIDFGLFKYEVADGQQRIRAIKDYLNGVFSLSTKTVNGLDLNKIGSFLVGDKKFSELNDKLKERFLSYKLTVAVVNDASPSEIRTLFGRLQMGDPLNPAEKRNAIISTLGKEIDNIAVNHDFFTSCKIAPERFKRQDFVTHIFALVLYKNRYDLKAPLLQSMYLDKTVDFSGNLIPKVVNVLTFMKAIDHPSYKRIVNKWSFVDIFRVIFDWYDKIDNIDSTEFAIAFRDFEKRRLEYSSEPELLIRKKKVNQEDEYLYNYIMAFRANGGNPSNLNKRNEALKNIFKDSIKFKEHAI